LDGDKLLRRAIDPEGIAEGAAEAGESDFHDVAICEFNAVAKAEGVRAEEMDVDIAGPTMGRILEVVMFQIGDGVGHIFLAGGEGLGPDGLA